MTYCWVMGCGLWELCGGSYDTRTNAYLFTKPLLIGTSKNNKTHFGRRARRPPNQNQRYEALMGFTGYECLRAFPAYETAAVKGKVSI